MISAGPRGRFAAVALCAALAVGIAAAGPLPIDIEDPATGRPVSVAPGPRALHVVFYATWCSPCTAEMSELAELESRWRDSGYRLVLVAVASRHTKERVVRFAEEHEVSARWLFDSTGAAQSALGADHLPTHVVFDAQGTEVARSGALDTQIRDAVAGLLRRRGSTGRP